MLKTFIAVVYSISNNDVIQQQIISSCGTGSVATEEGFFAKENIEANSYMYMYVCEYKTCWQTGEEFEEIIEEYKQENALLP